SAASISMTGVRRICGRISFSQAAMRSGSIVADILWLLASRPHPRTAARPGIGDAEMALQRGAVGGKRGAGGGMHDGAAFQDNGAIGDAEDFFGVLLDQNSGGAFVANDAAQRHQKLIDQDRRQAFERLVE